jgi:hypothetical protein
MNEYHPTPEFEKKIRRAMEVPAADPAFVRKLGSQLASRPAKSTARISFRPAWAMAMIVALALLSLTIPSVAVAIGRLFGYVPGMGLVENTGNLRTLTEPAAMQRDGVTLTITNAIVFPDRIELVYKVEGISAENDGYQAADSAQNPTAFCGGVKRGESASKDADAMLRLPDGTILERDHTGLYPQNAYAMTPVYKASLPADVTELTMILKCIPMARLGAVPENWEVPFKLASVPAGASVGLPVYTVQPTQLPASPSTAKPTSEPAKGARLDVSMNLEKVALTSTGMAFYFRMDVANPDPALQSVLPGRSYIIDSSGKEIPLTAAPIYPVQHPVGSLFEYFSMERPVPGPVTLVIENAVAYYAPLYVEPKQATPEEMSFTFDAGANPQPGQTWQVNQPFQMGPHLVTVTTVRAATFADIDSPSFIDGSQGYENGFEFTLQGRPEDKISARMDIMSDACWLYAGHDDQPASSIVHYTELCRGGYPTGPVTVTISELSVLVENTWKTTWSPQ